MSTPGRQRRQSRQSRQSRTVGLAILLSITAGTVVPTAPLIAQASLSLGDVAVMPGGTGEVALFLTSNPGATAMQVDLQFDSTRLAAGVPTTGLAEHLLASVEPQAGVLRLVVYSPTNALLPVGEVARVRFTAGGGAAPGVTPLAPTASEVATPSAEDVQPLTLASGSIQIFTVQANLGVQLSASASLVADGDPLTYGLVVSNPGPDAVTSAEVTDLVPVELSAVNWSCAGSGGASCTASGAGDVVDTVDLPVGGSATYTVAGTVNTGSTFIESSAVLEAPAEVFDPDTSDNSDSVSVDVCVLADQVLTGWDIGGVAVFDDCGTLTAGPDFNIQPTGDVTLRALHSVILGSGFSVESGGRLKVGTP